MVEYQIGIGRWICGVQDQLLGFHFMVSSMAIVMVIEMACFALPLLVLALLIKAISGRTLVEIINKFRHRSQGK